MIERYARQLLIPHWDQDVLGEATAVVVGVGALGTESARLLAQAGVGALVLCDPDVVSESNLSRGSLFTGADVGRHKVSAAAAALRALAPSTAVVERASEHARGVGLAELREADLVISCLDSIADRVQLAARCGLVGAAMLDGGTHPWGGEVRWYPPGGPCYGCGRTSGERALPPTSMACGIPDEMGASAPISAMVASWLVTHAIRVLFGLPVAQGMVRLDPVTGESRRMTLAFDPTCPLHEPIPFGCVTRTGLTTASPVGELLAMIRPDERLQAWNSVDPADPHGPLEIDASLAGSAVGELGIAPGELLPVIRTSPHEHVRYIELATSRPEGKDPR
ncbi:HesA/MoeB/ThiF family protein [Nonomuraea mangrovi]|uniref:HesA/MoeB/ThiF family protein n=1 Tax=Nonomuraea mangrovi TaxID=2316207 RepID=A0ABW4SMC4_9ACTN